MDILKSPTADAARRPSESQRGKRRQSKSRSEEEESVAERKIDGERPRSARRPKRRRQAGEGDSTCSQFVHADPRTKHQADKASTAHAHRTKSSDWRQKALRRWTDPACSRAFSWPSSELAERLNLRYAKFGNPCVYDNKLFPWVAGIERNWTAIRRRTRSRSRANRDELPEHPGHHRGRHGPSRRTPAGRFFCWWPTGSNRNPISRSVPKPGGSFRRYPD